MSARPVVAAFWMTGAVTSFSLMAVGGRAVADDLTTFELMFYRSLIGIGLVVAFGAVAGCLHQVRSQRLGFHATRNLFHFVAQNLWFYALALIPLAQLFAIEFTTPIWVALMAPLLLGERLTGWRVLAAMLGFAGILVVARPDATPLGAGHLAAALSTIGFCAMILTTKALARTDSTWTILFWMTVMQAVYGALVLAWMGDVTLPDAEMLPWVALVGLCGLTAHLSLTQALGYAPASVVAPMDFARLPVIALVGYWVYAEPLEASVALGAAMILAANTLNLWAERRAAHPIAKVFE